MILLHGVHRGWKGWKSWKSWKNRLFQNLGWKSWKKGTFQSGEAGKAGKTYIMTNINYFQRSVISVILFVVMNQLPNLCLDHLFVFIEMTKEVYPSVLNAEYNFK